MDRNATHTPGPWNAYPKQSDGERPIVANAGGCPDAVIAVVGYDCPENRLDANARLIAAAPDLLAVCLEIAEHGTDDWDVRMRTLRAAIAKATNP